MTRIRRMIMIRSRARTEQGYNQNQGKDQDNDVRRTSLRTDYQDQDKDQ